MHRGCENDNSLQEDGVEAKNLKKDFISPFKNAARRKV
ncbi:hypothetical protein NPIL_275331, partial [Nephila pilipes]